jgi:integrase
MEGLFLCRPGCRPMPKLATFNFTEHNIRKLKPQANRYWKRDSRKQGLLLRVYPSGAKKWYVQLDRTTYRKLDTWPVMTIAGAWIKATTALSDHSQGNTMDSARNRALTLKKFLTGEYKDHVLANNASGEADVARLLSCCKSLLSIRLASLTEIKLEKWKRGRLKEVKPSTAKRDFTVLKAALNKAVAWKLLAENPARHITVKVPKEKRVRFLSVDERKNLMAALSERDRRKRLERISGNQWRRERGETELSEIGYYADHLTPMVLLVLNTGLRRQEVLNLRWTDVRLTTIPSLKVRAATTKTREELNIPLNSVAVQTLTRWKRQGDSDDLVFPNPITKLPMRDIKTAWLQLMRDAEITDFRFHDLRHDFASRLVMGGVVLYRVKELLGHGSIAMTERYAHLAPEALAEAVEVLT